MGNRLYRIPDSSLKLMISRSLPPSWDPFSVLYIANATFDEEEDNSVASSKQFIDLIKQEYERREARKLEDNHTGAHSN